MTDVPVPDVSPDANAGAKSAAKPTFSHDTVLLYETVAAVLGKKSLAEADSNNKNQDAKPSGSASSDNHSGIYVDATFGRGGHSKLLLEQLSDDATLFVFDKDPEAIEVANAMAADDKRLQVIHDSFANMTQCLAEKGVTQVDGIMADLGVSSPQLDDGSRGFSFMRDGAIDMRMDTSRGQSVGEWLETVDEETLANVLYDFGEERHSRRIARAIKQMPRYTSTLELAEVIKQAHPKWQKGKHPATQSFQAMRIFINNELGDIDSFLQQSLTLLAPQGQLAVISFHSLEDRRIKQFLQRHSRGQYPEDQDLPMPPVRPRYFSKPKRIAPSKAEVQGNNRSRSAWLRVATRTDTPYNTDTIQQHR
ncbi:16S rRNA (cytosine(1402)-N(4))-methyltransferase RsmH [Psychrobacter sp. FDAARGOS_221]|uniref:16S rRNA (cytosine(1402)-N(4))-methyltransferase RsmH n=1 Tax=Psychrobacter sp. FDAARGOS_221 TaxID=1975705 RepID=UPI000BB5815F|nr:16S rRNA (cytosine(1402)-N(4))-methyltransferase RsmH [Psychrobacter sp. FDAARGOS_221]PNK60608.1 16S rRNA (cytosine(1402)-N(4))-methyltransferase RsmH [Psychrobacter sp. FDAARGOS_221]